MASCGSMDNRHQHGLSWEHGPLTFPSVLPYLPVTKNLFDFSQMVIIYLFAFRAKCHAAILVAFSVALMKHNSREGIVYLTYTSMSLFITEGQNRKATRHAPRGRSC